MRSIKQHLKSEENKLPTNAVWFLVARQYILVILLATVCKQFATAIFQGSLPVSLCTVQLNEELKIIRNVSLREEKAFHLMPIINKTAR